MSFAGVDLHGTRNDTSASTPSRRPATNSVGATPMDPFPPRTFASHLNLTDLEKANKNEQEMREVTLRGGGFDGADGAGEGGQQLQRQLKSRHVQMMSIGGVIGTGLFLGTANALRNGGPLGLLLGYGVLGTVCWAIMVSLGEMIAHLPIPGGHITLAGRFVDEAFSLAMGYNYWYNWTVVLPAELNAAAVLISYWNNSQNPAVWITLCLVVAVAINFGGTRVYGELEFWFASIKVITIVGLIILGIILDCGGGPNHEPIGFRYWKNPGAFRQYLGIEGHMGRFLGFWAVLIQAGFSFIGTEITAIAAGEAKNPKRNLPKAIKRVYIRICLFYIIGCFIIGLLVKSTDERLSLSTGTAASSPFVIAITDSGIRVLPSIINAALLSSAWSAASSDLYTSSRSLYGLSLKGNAPKICARVNSWGLPWVSVLVGTAFSLLSYMSAGAAKAGEVFGWFANMTSVCGLITWAGIAFTYIRFFNGLRAQGIQRTNETLVYRAPLQPYAAYYALLMCLLILAFNGFSVFIKGHWDTATFITCYMPIFLAPVIYLTARWWKGARLIDTMAMDFYSGSRAGDEDEEESKPQGAIARFWDWLM